MVTRDIADTFKEMYDVDVLSRLISKVTEREGDKVREWQSSPLNSVYPTVVYLAIDQASRKWTIPVHNWKSALNRFIIERDGHFKEMAVYTELFTGSKA